MDSRAERERQFHDQMAEKMDVSDILVRESFESPTAIENRYALSVMGSLKGKRVFDLGCGTGEAAIYFSTQGAQVYASDISKGVLCKAQSLQSSYQTRVGWFQSQSEKIPLADNSFDFVFGNGVLHHIDLPASIPEIARVLKPGGKAIFIEPLPYNPVINVYRILAKEVRTPDEKPISFSRIREITPYFTKVTHKEFWFFSLLIFIHFFLIRRWNPSKVRYWKRVIEVGPEYANLFAFLQNCDAWVLKWLPFLKPLCWNTVIVAEK